MSDICIPHLHAWPTNPSRNGCRCHCNVAFCPIVKHPSESTRNQKNAIKLTGTIFLGASLTHRYSMMSDPQLQLLKPQKPVSHFSKCLQTTVKVEKLRLRKIWFEFCQVATCQSAVERTAIKRVKFRSSSITQLQSLPLSAVPAGTGALPNFRLATSSSLEEAFLTNSSSLGSVPGAQESPPNLHHRLRRNAISTSAPSIPPI